MEHCITGLWLVVNMGKKISVGIPKIISFDYSNIPLPQCSRKRMKYR